MKIENEVTGEIVVRNASYIRVGIYLGGEKIDRFGIYLNEESIEDYLEHNTDKFLGVENTYEGYAQLVKDLGLEIPESYIKHWTPKFGEDYFYVDSSGEIYSDSIHKTGFHNFDIKRAEYYNMFPTRELAELGCNVSKLGRLILLWQYANDCIFTPDWSDYHQTKYNFYYNNRVEVFEINFYCRFQYDLVSFETKEQARAFVEMYEEEIKKIIGVE